MSCCQLVDCQQLPLANAVWCNVNVGKGVNYVSIVADKNSHRGLANGLV